MCAVSGVNTPILEQAHMYSVLKCIQMKVLEQECDSVGRSELHWL